MKTKFGTRIRRQFVPRCHPYDKGHRVGASTRILNGESSNPVVCPKSKEISHALRTYLALDLGCPVIPRTHAEMVAYQLLRQAEEGNLPAIREVTNRVEGRPRQAGEFQGRDPLEDLINEMRRFSATLPPVESSPEELEEVQ